MSEKVKLTYKEKAKKKNCNDENARRISKKLFTEEELNERRIEELADTNPKWYLHRLEEIKRGQ